jgi:hypothetical protein
MTEAKAHNFIALCKRILVLRKAQTESAVLRGVEQGFVTLVIGFMLLDSFVIRRGSISNFYPWEMAAYLFLIVFGLWLIIRLRQVRHALGLDQSQIVNRKS